VSGADVLKKTNFMNDKSTVILTTMASKTLMVVAQTEAFTFTPHLVSFSLLEESFTKGRISFVLTMPPTSDCGLISRNVHPFNVAKELYFAQPGNSALQ
jgi:hypothetical protein